MRKQQIIRVGSAERGGEKHERGSGDEAEGEERTKRQSWELKSVTEREREEEEEEEEEEKKRRGGTQFTAVVSRLSSDVVVKLSGAAAAAAAAGLNAIRSEQAAAKPTDTHTHTHTHTHSHTLTHTHPSSVGYDSSAEAARCAGLTVTVGNNRFFIQSGEF